MNICSEGQRKNLLCIFSWDRLLHVGDLLSGIDVGGRNIVSTEKLFRKMRNIGLFLGGSRIALEFLQVFKFVCGGV